VQVAFIALLNAELANVFRPAVIALFLLRPILNGALFGLIDTPDIADHMAGQLTIGVVAKQARLDLHTRETVVLRRKAGHLLVTQARAYGDGLKTFRFLTNLLEAASVTRRYVHNFGQFFNGLLQIGHS
jgi:hypothetical protein